MLSDVRKGSYRQGPLPDSSLLSPHRRKAPLILCKTKVLRSIAKSRAACQPTSLHIDYIEAPCAGSASENLGHSALAIHEDRKLAKTGVYRVYTGVYRVPLLSVFSAISQLLSVFSAISAFSQFSTFLQGLRRCSRALELVE